MENLHDEVARRLVVEACVAVAERETKQLDEELALALAEDLRIELACIAPSCRADTAAEAALALEALEDLLRV